MQEPNQNKLKNGSQRSKTKLGFNFGGFSWKRFFGISAYKAKVSRQIGIPLTRSGRQRKLGAYLEKALFALLAMIITFIYAIFNR